MNSPTPSHYSTRPRAYADEAALSGDGAKADSMRAAADMLESLEYRRQLFQEALWKACGDNAETVRDYITSVGGLDD